MLNNMTKPAPSIRIEWSTSIVGLTKLTRRGGLKKKEGQNSISNAKSGGAVRISSPDHEGKLAIERTDVALLQPE